MNNPKCPYCGDEMKFSYGYDGYMNGHYWYRCDNCNALAPEADSPEEAYAAAMKRDRAKGEWIWNTHEGWECRCSRCGEPLPILEFICKANYCPNCGAEMEGEE